mmetsp:Transcript_28048/g.68170  ORF Transcript_28048/g.68170 Transcript_28048/m.68170 type:complete len:325 (-) Transcript_28048:47-1021(-)
MFSMPSSATVTIFDSFTVSISHSGLMQPSATRKSICSGVPPVVAFEIAQHASLRMSNDAPASSSTMGVTVPASITIWIWRWLPAVMFDSVQHASLRTLFLAWRSSSVSGRSAPWSSTTCVCMSSPVTMLPTQRSAGVRTLTFGWSSSSTRRGTTCAWITAWIFSLVPSLRYDRPQHASVSISSSSLWIIWYSTGSAGCTSWNAGCGLPRQKLDSVQMAFLIRLVFDMSLKLSSSIDMAPCCSTKSRQCALSPAMLPSAQIACSRTSGCGECSSCTNMGTAPAVITQRVSIGEPDATLVSAHAASNCSRGDSLRRNSTNFGSTPV